MMLELKFGVPETNFVRVKSVNFGEISMRAKNTIVYLPTGNLYIFIVVL